MKILSFFVLVLFFFATACGVNRPVQSSKNLELPLTPYQYYSHTIPVGYPSAAQATSWKPPHSSPAEFENAIPETKSERRNVAIIGVLAGLLAVGGVVVPLVLINK